MEKPNPNNWLNTVTEDKMMLRKFKSEANNLEPPINFLKWNNKEMLLKLPWLDRSYKDKEGKMPMLINH
jgi:hypothetical protein